jgi:hypothetical protein
MLFYPYGQRTREVCDPELLSREYQNAMRLAQQTTHYQFGLGNPVDPPVAYVNDVVTVSSDATYAVLGGTDLLKLALLDGVSGDLFFLPINRGLADVTGMERSWTATYPELVIIGADYQYVRPIFASAADDDAWDQGVVGDRTVRFQLAIEVDGVIYPGTGPGGKAQDGKVRGTGFAGPDLRTHSMLVLMLPPGPHVVKVKAGIGPLTYSDGETTAPAMDFISGATKILEGGPALASRRLYVCRTRFGESLGA